MFERFTEEARQVVVLAQEEARRLHHHHIGTEHLLLGLLDQPGSPTAAVLTRHGLTRECGDRGGPRLHRRGRARRGALGTVGIDLDAVRSSVEATFGPGALDVPGRGRAAEGPHPVHRPREEGAGAQPARGGRAQESKSIADGHIALGLLREGEGLAAKVIARPRRSTRPTLRQEITSALAA